MNKTSYLQGSLWGDQKQDCEQQVFLSRNQGQTWENAKGMEIFKVKAEEIEWQQVTV